MTSKFGRAARVIGFAFGVAGLILVVLGPLIGKQVTSFRFQMEPLSYAGGLCVIAGLVLALAGYVFERRRRPEPADTVAAWSRLTQDYFDTFSHDLGRPFRRILGKQREVRARLEEWGKDPPPGVRDLLDEIEQQAPSFRLMLSNIRVLIELEDERSQPRIDPVDPAAVVRSIADRYASVAAERGAELSWWSEPTEFGLVYGDASALDHIVANLVDNAVRYASRHVELRLTRNPTHYYVRVWDDGKGVGTAHLPHLFDRGWTPEIAARRERTSSGLGLYIARTLARRAGGDIAVDSVSTNGSHDGASASATYTSFTVMLPLRTPEPARAA